MRLRSGSRRAVLIVSAVVAAAFAAGSSAAVPAGAAATSIQVTLTTANLSSALTPQPSIPLGPVSSGSVNVTLNDSESYQTIDGFGAAFTDSADYDLYNYLSPAARNTVMYDLFSRSGGIGLSFMREPMGSSDYTATPSPSDPGTYSYDDNGGNADPGLANFSTAHDNAYIIPIIKQAQAINPQMKLFANDWSPPAWMKTDDSMLGSANGVTGTLNADDYSALAQYYVKFLQSYAADGVNVWGITPQNEPDNAPGNYSGMQLTASEQANFTGNYLAPALSAAGLHTAILGGDEGGVDVSTADTLLGNATVYSDLYATTWHCYGNNLGDLTTIHDSYPGKPIYESECSTGPGIAPMNAAQAALESTDNWASGVDLWNLALDQNGGPKMGSGCTNCTGLVTVNNSTGAYSFTDNYYQLGQFSKFVQPGATRIGSTDDSGSGSGIWAQGYRNPDGSQALVAYNNNSSATNFTVTWEGQGSFSYTLPAGATVTFTSGMQGTGSLFTLTGQQSGRCLDDTGNPSDGVQQYIYDCATGNANQQYVYTPADQIEIGGKCLGASGNGTSPGTAVITWDCNGTPSQEWAINASGTVTNQLSGMCLDVTGQGTTDGTRVQLWTCSGGTNQDWAQNFLTAPGPSTVVNQGSGRCLDDTGNPSDGVQQYIYNCTAGNANQQYTYTADGQLQIGGKCLDASGNGTTSGTAVIAWDCNGTGSQVWTFNPDGTITNQLSGLCLDVTAGETGNGSLVQLSSCSGSSSQHWSRP